MNGTVARIRRKGIEATLDGMPALNDTFQVHRVISSVDTVIWTGRVHRIKGDKIRINTDTFTVQPEVGDLVRSV